MKCVKDKKGNITRVANAVAEQRVDEGKATYCSKSEWKEQGKK